MTAAPRFRPAEGPARGRIEGCDIDRENTTGLQAWTRQACGGAHSRPAGHRMAEARCADCKPGWGGRIRTCEWRIQSPDRKSTRLNSSHVKISYAVFCL